MLIFYSSSERMCCKGRKTLSLTLQLMISIAKMSAVNLGAVYHSTDFLAKISYNVHI